MEQLSAAILTAPTPEANGSVSRNGCSIPLHGRVRVEGKFLARGSQCLRVHGVTYGPFAPNAASEPFPAPAQVADDFTLMREFGFNAIRTYHLPPEWLLHLATEQGVNVFVDVPWRKHLCFLDGQEAQREAREHVRQAVRRGAGHP